MDAPTLTKNTAKSKPLKGSTCASSSCRNSLFANITPAIKAPNAGLNPTAIISSETPITKNREEAVKSSLMFDLETNLKKGTKTNLPKKIKTATPSKIEKGCIHSGKRWINNVKAVSSSGGL